METEKAHTLALPMTYSADNNVSPRSKRTFMGLGLPAFLCGLLVSLLAIIGFVMAAWATHSALTSSDYTFTHTGSILVTDLTTLQKRFPDFHVVANAFRGTGYWVPRPDMPIYRSDMGVVARVDPQARPGNSGVVLVGGITDDPKNASQAITLNKTVLYDSVFNTTRQLADMPLPRTRFGWAMVGDKLYIFGGFNSSADNATALSSMDVYDFTTNTWSTSPAQMATPRSDSCAGTMNGKIYNAGGYDTNFATLSSIEEFDPATQQWRTLPQGLQVSRGDCGAVVTQGAMYVMGGTHYVDNNCTPDQWYICYVFQSVVEKVVINADGSASVTRMADMLYPRGDFGYVETEPGRILVAGGESADTQLGAYRQVALPWVEELNVADNYWTPKSPLPEGSFRVGMAMLGGQALKFGGVPSCTLPGQSSDTRCLQHGLNQVLAFTDVNYPAVYIAARNV